MSRANINDMALGALSVWRMYVWKMRPTMDALDVSEETGALLLAIGTTGMMPIKTLKWLSGLHDHRSRHAALDRACKRGLVKVGKRNVRLTDAGKAVLDALDAATFELQDRTVEALSRRASHVERHRLALRNAEHPAGEPPVVEGVALAAE